MARKFSELTPSEQIQFQGLVDFMRETWNEDMKVKLSIIQRFNLDIKEPVVLDFLTDIYIPEQQKTEATERQLRAEATAFAHKISERIYPQESASVSQIIAPVAQQVLADSQVKSKKREMTYANSEDLIIIQNRLLHAISHLTLNERRLILFLSPIVRKGSDIRDEYGREVFFVSFSDFSSEYNLSVGGIYKTLKETAESVTNKAFFFWNIGKNKRKSKVGLSWFVRCEYKENSGHLEIVLSDEVIEMLTIFDANTGNFWTQYQKEWVINLGTYGIIMLEIVLSSLENKGYYTIEHLREKFNCVDTYPMFSDFKIWVVDKAIKEIEKHTPIRIKYEKHKTGRATTGLTFSYIDTSTKTIKDKTKNSNQSQKEQNPFVNFKMTQKQMAMFASKIKKASGQEIDEIIDELSNVHLQAKHIDFLKVLDFVPSAWYSDDEIKNHLTPEQIIQAKKQAKQQSKDKAAKEQKKLEQDFEILLANAEAFVLANQRMVRVVGVERHYFDQKDYQEVVKMWRSDLLDCKKRKCYKMVDELLGA